MPPLLTLLHRDRVSQVPAPSPAAGSSRGDPALAGQSTPKEAVHACQFQVSSGVHDTGSRSRTGPKLVADALIDTSSRDNERGRSPARRDDDQEQPRNPIRKRMAEMGQRWATSSVAHRLMIHVPCWPIRPRRAPWIDAASPTEGRARVPRTASSEREVRRIQRTRAGSGTARRRTRATRGRCGRASPATPRCRRPSRRNGSRRPTRTARSGRAACSSPSR